MTAGERKKTLLLVLLALVHIFVSMYGVIPGYLSMDEPTYHWMVKSYAEGRGFEIWNGYREFPSPELASAWTVAHNGRLVGSYPYLHPLLGLPFYQLLGFRGLFVMNSLAFLGVVALCLALAKKLFSDLDLALNACVVLILATFVWEYSQAAWTHMTALLFNLGASLLCYLSVESDERGKGAGLALASGLVAGFGVGIRLDLMFLLACLAAFLLLARPGRRRLGWIFLLGAVPGLAILSLTNHAKFGTLSPFSTGITGSDFLAEISRYLPLLLSVVALGVGAWVAVRLGLPNLLWRRKKLAAAILGLLLLAVLAIPTTRALLWKQVVGIYTLVVDLRLLPLDQQERAMLRSPGGGVLYIGGLKKALLQSCPYLVLLVLPALAFFRRKESRLQLGFLFLIPAAYIAFYSQFSWHGGLCLNLRYFTAILPYTSILTAYALRELSPSLGRKWRFGISVGALLMSAGFFLRGWIIRSPTVAETFYLTVPLILAGSLLIMTLLFEQRNRMLPALAKVTIAVFFAAALWSALVAFGYDYQLAQRARHYNLKTGLETAKLVSPDSIFFANSLDRFFALIESDRVRIARPSVDNFRDLPRLIEFHLTAERRAYAAFQPHVWRALQEGPLASFVITPIWSPLGFTMAEISAPTEISKPHYSE